MRDDILEGIFERDFVFGPWYISIFFRGMNIRNFSKPIPPASRLPDSGVAGGCQPPARSNVGESNKSIPGYWRYSLENALNWFRNATTFRYPVRPSSFVAPRSHPVDPSAPTRSPRGTSRPWNLADPRGETPRADLTITSYTTYLYLSPSISAHGETGSRGSWCSDTQPSPAAI